MRRTFRSRPVATAVLCLSLAPACGNSGDSSKTGAGGTGGAPTSSSNTSSSASSSTGTTGTSATSSTSTSSSTSATSSTSTGSTSTSSGAASCTTRITYGDAWVHPANHPAQYDDVNGSVTWDGTCTDAGGSSSATLSNGWVPSFTGDGACLMALDTTCAGAPACTTRVTYGLAWKHPANHPAQYDDIAGRVFWDRSCASQNGGSVATLSNGWTPNFTGAGACSMSFEFTGCGGLYQNAVLPTGCADPGVIVDGNQYVVACTSGDAADAFPLYTSRDLVTWTPAGDIFPSAQKPTWAASDFWAPEIHHVGSHYVAYFAARDTDGILSIGVATAPSVTGPFTDSGQPLVHDATYGMIDPTEFEDASGDPYLVWKKDGNAVGMPTPIFGQRLSADGTALTGAAATLITNDLAWEGPVTEAPWVVAKGGTYYLFYSGNSYANSTYAVGVASASSPLGPYTKAGPPILTSNATWVGTGHCSVIDTFAGDTYMVYAAWQAGHVNGAGDVRLMLTDAVQWGPRWPAVSQAPSVGSRPMP